MYSLLRRAGIRRRIPIVRAYALYGNRFLTSWPSVTPERHARWTNACAGRFDCVPEPAVIVRQRNGTVHQTFLPFRPRP